jgi:flagellin-like protein
MKTLRKIRKSTKALSPVVASIILIAVTVAVSIAVAAWMGALTVGFMGSSSITVTDMRFTDAATDGLSGTTITIDLKNTGTKSVTISQAKVNNDPASITAVTIDSGDAEADFVITYDWATGNPYKVDLYDGSGQVVGSYQATAPS